MRTVWERFVPRRTLAAIALLRPRVISSTAARADRAHRTAEQLRAECLTLRTRTDALESQLAQLSATTVAQARRIDVITQLHVHDAADRDELTACDADLRADHVRAHLVRAIAAAPLRDDPCPHMIVHDILPPNVYRRLVASLPPAICFDERPAHKARFLRVPFALAPEYSRRVWDFVGDLMDGALAPTLLDAFRSPIDEYIRSFSPAMAGQPIDLKVMDSRILLRRPGYRIPPHRDPKWGFLTLLLYLTRRGDTDEYGTGLYRVRGGGEPATTGEVFYVDETRCELACSVPARRNSALIFLNSAGAHGASIPSNALDETERYVYQARIGPDRATARRLVASMPDAARAAWRVYRGGLLCAIVATAAISFAACRQADGQLPPATGTVPNELGDISRDLQNLAGGKPEGPKDLSDDISHYAQGTNGGEAAAMELSNRLGQALTGKTFKLVRALPLARTCWMTTAARQLSDQQVINLQNDMKSELMSLGVNETEAQTVADQVGVVQRAVSARRRRWYELR